MDLATYTPMGGQEELRFLRRVSAQDLRAPEQSGLNQIVGNMAAVVVQVEHGDAVNYLAELAVMGPYRLVEARIGETHRYYVLKSQPEFPRLIVLEPLTAGYEDNITRWNMLYPLAKKKPNCRYIGEVYKAESVAAVREALEPQNIRFSYPGDTVNPFYTGKHLNFTTLSDHTYNRVGYTDVDLDDIEALGLGDVIKLSADELREARQGTCAAGGARHRRSRARSRSHGHAHPPGDREDALLEYLTMVPYYFWGAYNIHEMNSSTNVTPAPRHRRRPRSRRHGCSRPTTRRPS